MILYQGRSYKSYSGHGQHRCNDGGFGRAYLQDNDANVDKFVPEGIEGMGPFKGSARASCPDDGRSALEHGLLRLPLNR